MLYEDRVARFRWNAPSGFNFARDVIDAWAEDRSRTALYGVDGSGRELRLTFWDLAGRSRRFANALRGLGLGRGDAVILALPGVAEWPVAFLGVLRLGAIAVPCPAGISTEELALRARHSGARAVVAGVDAIAAVEGVRGECPSLGIRVAVGGKKTPEGWRRFDDLLSAAADDLEPVPTRCEEPALCFYETGADGTCETGADGTAKAVLHGHGYTWAHRYTGAYWLDLRPADLHWTTADPGRAGGVAGTLLAPWSLGVPVFLYSGRLETELIPGLLERYGITTLCAGASEYGLLAGLAPLRRDRTRLRHCVSAGGSLAAGTLHAWRDVSGLTIHDAYGPAETTLLVANVKGLPVRPGSPGKPFPGHDVGIVDGQGREAPPGESGFLALRGRPPSLFLEYWKSPEKTAASRRGEWTVTGDRGYRDEQGYFWRTDPLPGDIDPADLDRVRKGA